MVDGQSPQSSYDILKQRLLVAGTGNFIYNESRGLIDRDSANLFACRMYGYNRLLPYNEGFSDGVISPTSKLIDAGKIGVITNLLNYTEGMNKTRILLELGAYYLFKPGNEKADLDSAWSFLQQANANAEPECLSLLGKYYYQAGNIAESQKCFSKVVDIAGTDPASLAPAYENQGKYLPDNDPKKISYLERSLELYHKLQMKEKEIEVRMYIADINRPLAEKQWQQILLLQKAIGFRHTLYADYALSCLADQKADHKSALSYARRAIDNMQETGDAALACLFYTRMGAVYSHFNKPEEALAWYEKSYAGKKNTATQDFWYKGFISAANLLAFLGRAEEALSLMQEVTASFPPANTFDKMRLAFIKGYSYEHLKDNTLAAVNYDTFTSMAEQFPLPSNYTETPDAFYQVSLFYFNQGQMAKARTYLQKALDFTSGSMGIQNLAGIHLLFSKLDSAAGRYASALQYRIKYAFYRDSLLSNQMQELRARYETEKKDQNIQLLTQSGKLQQAALQQSGFLRNIILGGLVVILIIAGLLYWLKRVTNKKNTDLQHLAHEKEWLLKEANYRVKNNLQTIVSLLGSQSSVQDSQNRIYAMSLIHRRSENAAAVDIRSYLPELVNHLRESFDVNRQIHIHLHIPPLELDVSQAVPVTLIINEALTNAIRYAFPRKEIGQEISVCMEQGDDHEITLTIADNGIGVLPDLDSHLGLKLMDGLVDDINGTFAIRSAEGTTVSIHFIAKTPLHKAHHVV
ncbi:histidine kinase dimerization/phosphoacceptor domain -containing protein [Chitinophaga niabensis]|uniref:histidine kinase dimerization/phosphoacceptor domain -containing protein n=1 Tax=Chitinophaga niabensis TaxID=536979 RepID=UPI0009414B8F|nr:histidine kinase dimerization/phosphoacceptor domain -containing protein [Chitinophaga niabensis]